VAEPTTSAVAAAGSAGAGAFFVAAVGVHPSLLLFGAVGAIVGLTWAPPQESRYRALALMFAAAFVSAGLGAALAEAYFPTALHAGKGLAALIGAFLHPAMNASIAALPGLWSAITKRLGGSA
jgi:hypothetical protein